MPRIFFSCFRASCHILKQFMICDRNNQRKSLLITSICLCRRLICLKTERNEQDQNDRQRKQQIAAMLCSCGFQCVVNHVTALGPYDWSFDWEVCLSCDRAPIDFLRNLTLYRFCTAILLLFYSKILLIFTNVICSTR